MLSSSAYVECEHWRKSVRELPIEICANDVLFFDCLCVCIIFAKDLLRVATVSTDAAAKRVPEVVSHRAYSMN